MVLNADFDVEYKLCNDHLDIRGKIQDIHFEDTAVVLTTYYTSTNYDSQDFVTLSYKVSGIKGLSSVKITCVK